MCGEGAIYQSCPLRCIHIKHYRCVRAGILARTALPSAWRLSCAVHVGFHECFALAHDCSDAWWVHRTVFEVRTAEGPDIYAIHISKTVELIYVYIDPKTIRAGSGKLPWASFPAAGWLAGRHTIVSDRTGWRNS